MTPIPSSRDVKLLSAYLDGQLKPSDRARLEVRIQTELELASVLKDLRQARGILRQLPQRRALRNFTLTPKMVGQKPPLPRTYPVFRMASALATLLLFFSFATNFMAPRLTQTTAPYASEISADEDAAKPEMAMEAAPAESAKEERLATEEPAEPAEAEAAATEVPSELAVPAVMTEETEPGIEEFDAPQASPSPAPTEGAGAATADDSARSIVSTPQPSEKSGVQEIAPGEAYAQDVASDEAPQPQPAPIIGVIVQIALAGIAIISAMIALTLRYSEIRKWRAKAK